MLKSTDWFEYIHILVMVSLVKFYTKKAAAYYSLLSIVLIITAGFTNAQEAKNTKVDSLQDELQKTVADTSKIILLCKLADETRLSEPHVALQYAQTALKLSEKIEFKKGKINANYQMAIINKDIGNYSLALEISIAVYNQSIKTGDKKSIINALSVIAEIYRLTNNASKSLENYFLALKMAEELKDSTRIFNALGNIAMVYSYQGKYNKAQEINFKIAKFFKRTKNQYALGLTYSNIAAIYFIEKKINEAIKYYTFSKEASMLANDLSSVAISLNNIGSCLQEQGRYKDAMKYFFQSLYFANKVGDKRGKMAVHKSISDLNALTGNYRDAYEFNLKYTALKDSIFDEQKMSDIAKMSAKYETDKKQKEIEILNKEKENQIIKKEADDRRKNIIILSITAGLILVIIFSFFLINRFNFIRKQKNIIEKKNIEITDSINYAKRIQEAILPTDDEFETAFPDSFVLFKPKDIVSGDFYWISTNPKEFPAIDKVQGENWKVKNPLVAAVDCTGHGVPGSLMSMMGNSLLNKIVDTHKISKPNEILNTLRTEIINSLKQHSEKENKDGMDIALCTVYDDKIEFAGANNPIYVIRKNGNLEELKTDKMPIGYSGVELKPYTNHSVKMEEGDSFYIFTDGYADQFGGKGNKKFKYKKLKDLLITINSQSMQRQKEILSETIENWRGINEQTDDILIIGIRI
jgi:serine phosphatase RsbU (regulator of sigma subunit)